MLFNSMVGGMMYRNLDDIKDIWDDELNDGSIYDINPNIHSGKYYWVCPVCGRTFKRTVFQILNALDKGFVHCDECVKGFMPSRKGKSLLDLHKELSEYWDYVKNNPIKPDHIKPQSSKEVWWICPYCGKSYLKAPRKQVLLKANWRCSDCMSTHKTYKSGVLSEAYPEIALDWGTNDKSPNEVSFRDSRKYNWKCHKCGYEWVSSVELVTGGRSRCKVCSGRVYKKGYTDLKTKFPDVANDWDYLKNTIKPEDIMYTEYLGNYWFICPICGKSHKKSLGRAKNTRGLCRSCSIKVGFIKSNGSLLDVRPDLSLQLDTGKSGITADRISPSSTDKVWWKCDKGHSFLRSPSDRVRLKGICPICNGKEVLKGFNDLASCYPDIAKYWCYELNNISPSEVTKQSHKEVWWVCPICGEYYMMSVVDRTQSVGCYNCNLKSNVSKIEKEFTECIRDLSILVNENSKIFNDSNMSVDLYLEEYNIALEFNGLYWHSEKYRGKDYHYRKYKMCKDLGVKLYYVWEDDFKSKRNVVLNIIKNKLGLSRHILKDMYNIIEIDKDTGLSIIRDNTLDKSISGDMYLAVLYMDAIIGVFSLVKNVKNSKNIILNSYYSKYIIEEDINSLCDYLKFNTEYKSLSVVIELASLSYIDIDKLEANKLKYMGLNKSFIDSNKRVLNIKDSDRNCIISNDKVIWNSGSVEYVKEW